MSKDFYRAGLVTCLLAALALPANALERGPILANNILGGAAAGTLVGFSAGLLAYGQDNNYHADYLLTGAVYGFLGGALLGGGVAMYEIGTGRSDTGFTLSEYLAGGTSIGALMGFVVATIPFMRDKDPEDFTIGIGLGGLIGASLGLVVALVDINARNAEGDTLLSGQMGILDMSSELPALVPGQTAEPVFNCKLVKVTF